MSSNPRGRRGYSGRGRGRGRSHSKPSAPQSPRPTHFLCFPLTSHTGLHRNITAFQNALLNGTVDGLDDSICVQPIRMHLTLGVMALDSDNSTSESTPKRTVADALALLRTLKDDVDAILASPSPNNSGSVPIPPYFRVRLEKMGIFTERGQSKKARVLWIGPNEDSHDDDTRRLRAVANHVLTAFRNAGFITDTRPLTLHCTLLNTTYRRPRPANPFGFSFEDIMASTEALALIGATALNPMPTKTDGCKMDVKLGTWPVPSIELCIMGSRGPKGEYVSCGGIELGKA